MTSDPALPAGDDATVADSEGRPEGSEPGTRRFRRNPVRPTTSDPGRTRWHDPERGPDPTEDGPVRKRWRKVLGRTASKAWDDSLFGMSSQAAFWCALSTAPMLLALLGLIGPLMRTFNPSAIPQIREQIDRFLLSVFNEEIAENLIGSMIDQILNNQGSVVSIGLLISLWAGSSAMAAFVEAITSAYNQHEVRHPVKERFFALGLYLGALLAGIVMLPLLAIGPRYLVGLFPDDLQDDVSLVIQISYFPALLIALILLVATLYKVAPQHRHPWKRGLPGALLAGVLFLILSIGLRLYLEYVYSHGLTYGALATPITFLLFYYFASMAIVIGAQFNNALLEYHPPRKVSGRLVPLPLDGAGPTRAVGGPEPDDGLPEDHDAAGAHRPMRPLRGRRHQPE
ncbi:YihY/virulence factor BrkB family protein [Blastococcus sp. Marseille-P5729]|uniref:YihY/virulence factor BrkB family protein n=1 Tax=Blastococcus sp. Marseille-P5729 TaxID=2086582 RepID=UPI0018FE8D3F|nr:YihY/virulence factor BrkB family protein [Blastococcus sp. Marseille-P5729]